MQGCEIYNAISPVTYGVTLCHRSMLLRLTVPLLETSAAGASQLLPRRALAIQTAQIHSSAKDPFVPRASQSTDREESHWAKENKNKRNDLHTNEAPRTGKIKLLAPYDLSKQVEALCRDGDLAGAISLVKTRPLDAQNAVVWATLIRPVLAAGRYQEAYRLFIDVRSAASSDDPAKFLMSYR